ncbi:MAG: DUF1849 family protein [Rhodospirillales bacterium]
MDRIPRSLLLGTILVLLVTVGVLVVDKPDGQVDDPVGVVGAPEQTSEAPPVGTVDPGNIYAGLVPHRAFYSLELLPGVGAGTVGGLIGAEGVMTMSLEQTCDGWIFTQDMNALFDVAEGPTIRQTALFTSWESNDGADYRFASKVSTDGLDEVLRGDAVMAEAGGTAYYRQPETVDVSLPGGTMFPVSHTAWLIAEARAGKRQASKVVFTGSEDLQPELVNAFIADSGSIADLPDGVRVLDVELTRRPGWNLRMAFYPMASPSGLPTLEMRALQLDNGVAPWLIMDFGDFATLMTAERVEALPPPSCT